MGSNPSWLHTYVGGIAIWRERVSPTLTVGRRIVWLYGGLLDSGHINKNTATVMIHSGRI